MVDALARPARAARGGRHPCRLCCDAADRHRLGGADVARLAGSPAWRDASPVARLRHGPARLAARAALLFHHPLLWVAAAAARAAAGLRPQHHRHVCGAAEIGTASCGETGTKTVSPSVGAAYLKTKKI